MKDVGSLLSRIEARWKLWLLCLTVVGFVLRAWSWSYFLCDSDSYIFMLMARNLRESGVFSGTLGDGGNLFLPGTSILYKWLYPVAMAPLLAVMEPEVAGHIVSLISGTLFVPAMFFAARAISGDTGAGIVAAALACFSYSNAAWSGHVLAESLCSFLLAMGLWQGIGRGGTRSGSMLAGLFFAAALATRPEMAVVFPGAFLATLAASRRGVIMRAGLFCIGALLVLGPVSLVVMKDMASPFARAAPAGLVRKNLPAPTRVLKGRRGLENILHFSEQEIPLVLSVICAPFVLAAYRRPLPMRYIGYAAYHSAALAGIYHSFIAESYRYYTHLIPALIPLGAAGLATLARHRPANKMARTARMACLAGVLLGMTIQTEQIISHGHRAPGYEKEAAAIVRKLMEERGARLPANLVVVSRNRCALYALTGLPAIGFAPPRKGQDYLVRKQSIDCFTHFLLIVDAHARAMNPEVSALGSRFPHRRIASVRIPAAMDPVYKAEGLRFKDDLFEFYLLTREEIKQAGASDMKIGDEGG